MQSGQKESQKRVSPLVAGAVAHRETQKEKIDGWKKPATRVRGGVKKRRIDGLGQAGEGKRRPTYDPYLPSCRRRLTCRTEGLATLVQKGHPERRKLGKRPSSEANIGKTKNRK